MEGLGETAASETTFGNLERSMLEDDDQEAPSEDEEGEYDVIVEGNHQKVTLREALNGYIRQETFHQRLNRVNEAQIAVQRHAHLVQAVKRKYVERLQDAENLIKSIIALYIQNPKLAKALEKTYRNTVAAQLAIDEERAMIAQESEIENQRATRAYAEAEAPKFFQIAGWQDQKERLRDLKAMRNTALNAGFSEEEVSTVYDSRMLNILLKASRYDRIKSGKSSRKAKNKVRSSDWKDRSQPPRS